MNQLQIKQLLDTISITFGVLTWFFALLFCVYVFYPSSFMSFSIRTDTIYTLFVAIVSAITGWVAGRFRLL